MNEHRLYVQRRKNRMETDRRRFSSFTSINTRLSAIPIKRRSSIAVQHSMYL